LTLFSYPHVKSQTHDAAGSLLPVPGGLGQFVAGA